MNINDYCDQQLPDHKHDHKHMKHILQTNSQESAPIPCSQNPDTPHQFVSKSEMAQVIYTVVQHYEKRVEALESVVQTLMVQMQDIVLGNNCRQPLQSNSSHLNHAIPISNNSQMKSPQQQSSESLNFDQTSIKLSGLIGNGQKGLINEIQQIINGSQDKQPKINIIDNQSKQRLQNTKDNENENIKEKETNILPYKDALMKPVRKQSSSSQKKRLASQTQTVKKQENCNYSDAKGKISIFSLHQFNSPSDTSCNQTQQSPRQANSSVIKSKFTNQNLIHSEYAKQYVSSPDSLMCGVDSQNQRAGAYSSSKNTNQMNSICTQDFQINDIQSPLQMKSQKQSLQKTSKPQSKLYQKSQFPQNINPLVNANHNLSLSILLEEDSKSHKFLQNNTLLGHCLSTHDGRISSQPSTLKDQRMSLKVHQNSTGKLKVDQNLIKQRSTTSLGNKSSNHISTITQNSFQNPRVLQRSIKGQQNAHCMIQKNNRLKSQQQSNQMSKKYDKHYENQSSAINQDKKDQQKLVDFSEPVKQKIVKKSNNSTNQKKSVGVKKSLYQGVLTSSHNSNKHNNGSHEQSIAKIYMPQLVSDKLFKIKNPLGVSRTKNQNFMNSMIEQSNTHSTLQSQKENIDTEGLKSSKTFDQTNKDPLTMRDLEILEQNQFKISQCVSAQNNQDFQITKTFDDVNFDKISGLAMTSTFENNQPSRKNSSHSSLILYSSRNKTQRQHIDLQQCSQLNQSSLITGSLTLREKSSCSVMTPSERSQSSRDISSKHGQNSKKRAAACRLLGSNAETRLNNLVQTIQRYKNEADVKSTKNQDSHNHSQTFNSSESSQSQLKETRLTSATQKSISQKSQSHQSITSHINNNHSKSSLQNSMKSQSLNLSQKNGNVKNSQDKILQEKQLDIRESINVNFDDQEEEHQFDNFDISHGIIQLSNEPKKTSSDLYDSDPYNSVKTVTSNDSQNSQQQIQKSRNIPPQEYFSFSNLESANAASIQEDTMTYKNQIQQEIADEDRQMSRSSTMIKLTVDNKYQSHQVKTTFLSLTGDVLDLISEYLPQNPRHYSYPPLFILCHSLLIKNYSLYKHENLQIQISMLTDQIQDLKEEIYEYFTLKCFKMSKGLSVIFYSNIQSKEWQIVEDLCTHHSLSQDDQTLLRVYLLLLGHSPNQDIQQVVSNMIKDHKGSGLNQVFNPEMHFTFGPQILCKVGQQLQNFSLESYIINYSKPTASNSQNRSPKIRSFQILAQIIYEALQFCKIVPNRIESDIRELERAISQYQEMQRQMEKMLKNVDKN